MLYAPKLIRLIPSAIYMGDSNSIPKIIKIVRTVGRKTID